MNAGRSHGPNRGPILITGGAGFIGCNIADALVRRGDRVLVFDNFSRAGADEHALWLTQRHPGQVDILAGDVRDPAHLSSAVAGARGVLHLAGQVAVTTSLESPCDDFEINARGTLNVLEAVRLLNPDVPLVFASTNKVYGRLLEDDEVVRRDRRYVPERAEFARGVSEAAALDFHSPYGCSKGAADQYVRDYARVFGLRCAVLRMSCIYGPRQFGTEDQGWIAHFFLQAIHNRPITIYGSGLQVRDALHVSDAAAAWLAALDRIDEILGGVFNLGGGASNSTSLLELLDLMRDLRGQAPEVSFAPWRPGDQPWYVSDIAALGSALQWRPRTSLADGLHTLNEWLESRFGKAASAMQYERVRA
jgi:CDP-paratose 2-epimerase